MNKIEQLPKFIYIDDNVYSLAVWITAFNRISVGYKNTTDRDCMGNPIYLCSVCVEPENEPFSVLNSADNYMNKNIGNMPTFDDACDDLMNYIKVNNIKTTEQ